MTQLEFLLSTIDFQTIIPVTEWTFKVSAGASYTTNVANVTTLGVDTTGCNLIVLSTGGYDRPITISDNKGNTWTATSNIVSGFRMRMYYCLNPNVGPNHTFKAEDNVGGGYYGNLHMLGFDGATTAPYAYESTSIRPFFGGSRYTTASIAGTTPSINKSLFILAQQGANAGLTQGSNILPPVWINELYNKNAQNLINWTWYQIQGTASSVSVTFSYGTWSGYMLTALNNYIR